MKLVCLRAQCQGKGGEVMMWSYLRYRLFGYVFPFLPLSFSNVQVIQLNSLHHRRESATLIIYIANSRRHDRVVGRVPLL